MNRSESQRKKNEKFSNNIYKCKCKHCGSRFKTLKEVRYTKNESISLFGNYGALCHKCFYENLIDALILETEKNENLYKKFIKFKRDVSLTELGI